MWADTKTEGFETKGASTTYNSTVEISAAESDCGIAWSIYYGTVSTNDKISGTKSAQMRWYANAKENIPYIKTTTAIDGLSNVALKARTSNLDVKMDVCYSTDGETWIVGKTHTFTKTGTGEDVSLDIPSGNQYVKFEVSSSSTAPSSGNYKLIVDDVTFTYTSSKVDASWTLDPTSATVMAGESTTLQLTTNYDGTLNFVSNNEDVAMVSYNSTTKVITVSGVAAGTTNIAVLGDATSNYNAISKSIPVTVNRSELAYNMTDVMGPLGYSYFGLTGDKGTSPNEYAQPDEISRTKTDAYGVTLLFEKGESSTALRYDASYMRFYNKNTLTVTAPSGSYITKIVFTEPELGKSWAGSMTADNGEYVEGYKTWYANETGVTSVVLTNDNTKRIGGIEVYLMVSSVTPTIGEAGYATFAAPVAVDFSATSVEVFTAAVSGSSVVLTPVDSKKVPANTAVVLKGATATGTVIESAEALTGNELKVSDGTVKGDGSIYVLAKVDDNVRFYKLKNDSPVPAGKAYLQVGGTNVPEFLDFEENTTGIDAVRGQKEEVRGEFYNLAGQRVAQPTKGLYIVNGKKIVIK